MAKFSTSLRRATSASTRAACPSSKSAAATAGYTDPAGNANWTVASSVARVRTGAFAQGTTVETQELVLEMVGADGLGSPAMRARDAGTRFTLKFGAQTTPAECDRCLSWRL